MPKQLVTVSLILFLTCFAFAGKTKPEPNPVMPDVTARGRALYEYDQAAWHATDAVQAMHPPDQSVGRYLALKSDKRWTVVFGHLNDHHDKFLIGYEATQGAAPQEFTVKKLDPPEEDTAFYLAAAKAFDSLKLLLTTQDQPRCHALTRLLAQNQTWQVPTLAWQRGGTFLDQRDLKHQPLEKYVPAYWRDVTWRRFTDEMMPDLLRDPLTLRQQYFASNLQMVGALHRAGVPFMAGTDSAPGVYIMPGFSLHDELANFVEAGFTPMESLQTATSNPAMFLGRESTDGSVESGKIADLVLLSANPLDDIHNTQKITAVIASGQVFDRAALDQILIKVEFAAKQQK
jgi:hypothetical protein